jgi:hypothetical protein
MKKLTTLGRLNRREARKAVADLEKDLATQKRITHTVRLDADYARRSNYRLTDTFAAIASLVARHSVLAGVPTTLNKNQPWLGDDRMNVALVEPLDFNDFANIPVNSCVQQEVLRLLEVKAVRDSLRGVIHAHVHLAGSSKVYGVSETALRRMSMQELTYCIERELAPQLARALSKELKQVYR